MVVAIFSQGDLLGLAGVYGYVVAVVIISWSVRNRLSNPRKIVHVLTGGIVFFWWSFDSSIVMAGLAALPFVPLLLLATPKSPIKALKDSPLGLHSSEGHPYGLVLYAISWTMIAYFLFDDLFAASIAIAAMSFGDGMGGVIGERFGRIHYSPRRTVEGSIAVFVATAVSIVVLTWFYFSVIGYSGSTEPYLLTPFALAVAGLVTLLEAQVPGSVDNLVVPLMIAAFLHVMGV
jgi:phytol kinase